MKVYGFTLVRNAIRFDFPVVESLRSILPLCDKVYVAVGNSDDDTLSLVRSIDPEKIIVLETVWDDNLREGGRVLALETEKAFSAVPEDADWCFYIQADEVVHEKYHDHIRKAMRQWKDDSRVDGLLFDYLHFYGSYGYVADAYNWYRKEIRIVRRNAGVYSYRDAQGFRKMNNQKLCVKPAHAWVYHYGWVKEPKVQQAKRDAFHKLWRDDRWLAANTRPADTFDYSGIDSLKPFDGQHPEVMKPRVAECSWNFEFDISKSRMKWKYRIRQWIERLTGRSIGEYRNYHLLPD